VLWWSQPFSRVFYQWSARCEENWSFKTLKSLTWWFISIIPVLARLKQEDYEFEVSLGYFASPCLNTPLPQNKNKLKKQQLWECKYSCTPAVVGYSFTLNVPTPCLAINSSPFCPGEKNLTCKERI
jgi:hypothetical protein